MSKFVNGWKREPALLVSALVAVAAAFGYVVDEEILNGIVAALAALGGGVIIRSQVTPNDSD